MYVAEFTGQFLENECGLCQSKEHVPNLLLGIWDVAFATIYDLVLEDDSVVFKDGL